MPKKAQSGWHPEQIKAELRRRFGPITHLSVTWGHNPTAITQVLRRRDYSKVLEQQISEALGISLHELWPSRWTEGGVALSRHHEFEPIETSRVRTSQNARAA